MQRCFGLLPLLSGAGFMTLAIMQPTTAKSVPPTTTISLLSRTASSSPPAVSTGDYSPAAMESLWALVGPVESPPVTTTVAPSLPIAVHSAPPALYPSWFAPQPADIFPNLTLPPDFLFGVATSAYQVEGAVKEDGKGPTVWDWASRQPDVMLDNSTADITALQYYYYKEDVARMAALGVNTHSFSISWARIYPFGTADSPLNQAGLDHYSDLINYHLSMGVKPMVTLFHWDVPLALEEYYGGFTSTKIVDDFVNYAKTVFTAFNGTVTTWVTFNEPTVFCSALADYPFNGFLAPGVNSSTAPYQCAYNLLNAHAGAVKAFRAMNITGEIGYKNAGFVGQPWRAGNTDDTAAVERNVAFGLGWFSDPVYTTGDWPDIMKQTLPSSYLPSFTAQQSSDLLGSADFYAIDDYSGQYIAAPSEGLDACIVDMSDPNWPACTTTMYYDSNAGWAIGPSADPDSPWDQAAPQNLRFSLQQLYQRWSPKKMYISEFGIDEPFEEYRTEMYQITEDVTRTNYYMTYLGEALLSIHEDGIPLAGAIAWSVVDNAEWYFGYTARYGIQYLNHTTLERTYKRSALALSQFFKAHLQDATLQLPQVSQAN